MLDFRFLSPRRLAPTLLHLAVFGWLGACARTVEPVDADANVADANVADANVADASTLLDASDRDAATRDPVRVFGTAYGFGMQPPEPSGRPHRGLATFVRDDVVLFGEALGGTGLSMSLVRMRADGLDVLAQTTTDLRMDRYFGSWDWSDRFTTFFVPLDETRVVTVASRQRIELFSLEGDAITSEATLALHPSGDSRIAGAGRGDRFFTCAGYALATYRIEAGPAIVEDGAAILLPSSCRGLSMSPDGRTLWAATTRGIAEIDITGTAPIVVRTLLANTQFFRADEMAGYLVAQALRSYGELGSIHVFRREDVAAQTMPTAVHTFSPRATGPYARPIGYVRSGDVLGVMWFRLEGTRHTHELDRHRLTDTGVGPRIDHLVTRDTETLGLHLSALTTASSAHYAVLAPYRRIVRFDVDSSSRAITGRGHGTFDRIWPGASRGWLAVGTLDVHRLEVNEPGAPLLREGGTTLAASTDLHRIAPLGRGGAMSLLTPPSPHAPNVQTDAAVTRITCLDFDGTDMLAPTGTVTLAGRASVLASAPSRLFRASRVSGSTYRVQRIALTSRCEGQRLSPDDEVDVVFPATTTAATGMALAVDETRDAWLVSEALYQDPSVPSRFRFAWRYGPAASEIAFGEVLGSTDTLNALVVAGDRAFALENGRALHQLVREGPHVIARRSVALDTLASPFVASAIVHVDTSHIYLARTTAPFGVVVLRADDLSFVADHASDNAVRSIVVERDAIIMGTGETVRVVPWTAP